MVPFKHRPSLLGIFSTIVCLCGPARATVDVGLAGSIASNESGPRFSLTWNGVGSALYGVQVSSNVPAPWMTIDVVKPTNATMGPVRWTAPETLTLRRFYRLTVPQPEVFSVEPAVFPPGTPAHLFVLGQFFESNDVIRIDGVVAGPVTFVDHTQLQVTAPLQAPGVHTVELVRGGIVISTLQVLCEDETTYPERVLQEPPELPPGAPLKMKAKEKANRTKCGSNLRLTSSGQIQVYQEDLVLEGRGLDFVWGRTYLSRTGTNTAQGARWSSSYDIRCATNGVDMDVFDGAGRKDTFRLRTNGLYACDGMFREGVITGGAFRLTFADTGFWEFNPLNGSTNAGKISRSVDRNGNRLLFVYSLSGQLVQVIDTLDRTNSIAYDPDGRVSSVTDAAGRTTTYSYYHGLIGEDGGDGDLAGVTTPPVIGTPNTNDFPGGKTTVYTYSHDYPDERENHQLLSIVDPIGQPVATFTYEHNPAAVEFLDCVTIQRGADLKDIRRVPLTITPSDGFATEKVFVNDNMGNLTEYFIDSRQRCVMTREYTGRSLPGQPVSDTENRPTGKLRAADPDYFETRYVYNNDSLCTKMKLPRGNDVEYTYESDFDKTTRPRKRADLRVVRVKDFTGALPECVSTYQHDPRFGTCEWQCRDWAIFDGAIWEKIDNSDMRMRDRINALENVLQNVGLLGRCVADTTGPFDPTKWGVLGSFSSRGPRQTTSVDGSFSQPDSGRIRPKGWDGTIKGHVDEAGRKKLDDIAPLSASGNLTDTGRIRPKGWDGTIKGRLWDEEANAQNFITSATDPRGNTTTLTYDSHGNLQRCTGPFTVGNDPPVVDFAYDSAGQLLAITNAPDANGRRRVDHYGWTLGHLTDCAVDSGGTGLNLAVTMERDGRGNLTRYVDLRGYDHLYVYNALDQVVRCETPVHLSKRTATDIFYDGNDNVQDIVAEIRDETDGLLGTRTQHFTFDALDRLVRVDSQVDAFNSAPVGFIYDGNDNMVVVAGGDAVTGTDPFNVVLYVYDERDLLFQEVTTPGASVSGGIEWTYTLNGQPATKHYVDGLLVDRTNTYSYDGFDRQLVVQDAMGNTRTRTYDAAGHCTFERCDGQTNDVAGGTGNRRLSETRFEYDPLNRLTKIREMYFNISSQAAVGDGEKSTVLAYAPNGDVSSVRDDFSRFTRYAYDNAGRLASVTDPLSNRVEYVYDSGGNVITETRREKPDLGGPDQVFTRTFAFDPLDRCVSSIDNAGNTNAWQYSSLGCTKSISPRGVLTTHVYDFLGRRLQTIEDLDNNGIPEPTHDAVTSWGWSIAVPDRLVALLDGHFNVTLYDYDSMGQCTNVTGPDGTRHSFVWNYLGEMGQEQDANGTVILRDFDGNGRCISRSILPGPTVATNTTFELFEFDGLSRVVRAHNDAADVVFDYDSLNHCLRETLNGLSTTSSYDSIGGRLSVAYPGGRVLTYSRDGMGRCSSVNESNSAVASFAYEGPRRPARISFANNIQSRFIYDGAVGGTNAAGDLGWRQVSVVRHSATGGTPVLNECLLGWDRSGNKISRTESILPPALPKTNNLALQYDPADRLVHATATSGSTLLRNTVYGLDQIGNRTNVTGAATCSGAYEMNGLLPGPMDYQVNQYTVTPCDERTYDDKGNLVGRSTTLGTALTYAYDHANRLVSVSDGGLVVAAYDYDVFGRRIARTVIPSGQPPVTTHYIYDGGSVIEEREGSTVTASYVQKTGGSAFTLDGSRSSDDEVIRTFTWTQVRGPLAMRRGGHDYYYLTDDQGSVVALADSSGNAAERYLYDDYGTVTFLTSDGLSNAVSSSALGNPYLFKGWERDAESSLYHVIDDRYLLGLREYNPALQYVVGDCAIYADSVSGRYLLRAGVPLRFTSSVGDYIQDNPSSSTCAIKNRPDLKAEFQNGDIPDQNDFADVIDSYIHQEDDGVTAYAKVPRQVLKEYFQTGDKPTSPQFSTMLDSMVNARHKELTGHVTLIK